MTNAFTLGQGVPAQLVAGDAWAWRADGLAVAYPSPEYVLTYHLAPQGGGAPIGAAAAADATGLVVGVPAATTAGAAPGPWRWTLTALRLADNARATIAAGAFRVWPDLTTGGDTRSQARRLLDAINAVLEKRITKDVENYSIEGRALTRTPLEVLRSTRARLMREVAAEDAAAAGRPGGLHHRKVRFGHGR
ncbi:hypothetical protein RCCRONUS_5 [Rhodobacter phage RcCronus]|uniref:Head-to-tail joining protein n=2 Tax=Cronusvirus cronus TaxID=2005060 RepID=A0A0K1Y6G7_9CAUD|nr:head-tail joining [Rhodobacter phage RcCronus]AKU43294.1 hypothetical protein RCCRONUS_5 [Rhodobacter phage RcCronus]AKY02672.1 head-to-tail joining protein [Rhodobacter phage RcSaxon]